MALKHLLLAGVVATLASFTDAHSALLSNGKLLGKLNGGACFNCAVGQYPVPASIPKSAVDTTDPADGIAAYIKSAGLTVKDVWKSFHAGTSYGSITEPEAIKSATCGRYDPTVNVGEIPSGAKISYKKSNHNGPGEVWVDDKKTWVGDDFITDGKSLTADAFKCDKASCNVRWYWIGKVKVKGNWDHYQLYVQCFVVQGSGSGSASNGNANGDGENENDNTPAVTTKAPTPAPAPATGGDGDNDDAKDDATPGTVAPSSADGSAEDNATEDKAAKKAAKEKRRAEKEAKKAAKKAAKDGKNLRSGSGSSADSAAPASDEYN